MTALTVSPPSKTTSPEASPLLTGPLKSWLLDERSDDVAVRTIQSSPILREQARAVLFDLHQEALRPATTDEIKGIVGQRFALFPQPERSDGEWDMWWADYIDALAGLTPFAIEAGMAAWVRHPEAEFMCKPGKLRELATTTANNNRWARAYDRAKRATHVELPPPEPEDRSDRPTKEQIAAMMAEFHATMAEKDPHAKYKAKAARPTPSARVDNTGISQEMRAKLAEQRGEMG